MLTPVEYSNLLNLLENVAGELLAHLLERLGQKLRWSLEKRALSRDEAAAISPGLARDLLTFGMNAHPEFTEQDWSSAFTRLREAVEAARAEGMDPVLEAGLSAELLAEILLERGATAADLVTATTGSEAAYNWLIEALSPKLVAAFGHRTDFDAQLAIATLQHVALVRRALNMLIERLPEPPWIAYARFERRYLDHVAQTFGRFELFGVNRGREPSKQTFEESYVSLTVARTNVPGEPQGRDGTPEDEEELTGAGVAVSNAFSGRKRVLLRGAAGSGKTTLLTWLAAYGAAGELTGESGPWGEVVPFMVRLRDFHNRELPAVEDLPAVTAPAIDGERPSGWATKTFQEGRALLLVDGVDELPAERRVIVQIWIEALVTAYPAARYVVTVRPFAVPGRWLSKAPCWFDRFDVLPLSAKGIKDLLVRWYAAAKRDQSPERQAWLDVCQTNLMELMQTRPDLRRLATSPLLCGLLCALYLDRDMQLPKDRKSLLADALDLLLFRWNEEHGFPPEEDGIPSREEQTVLLQRFAYSMVKNQDLVVDRLQAAGRIAHALRGMRSYQEDPQRVLSYLLERTGLFQEPQTGQIQFVHRTFRDYLAAKEVVESGELAFLLTQAHLDQWHEVVIMAVAHARPGERNQLLGELLHGNQAARTDQRIADRLTLLAAASLEQVDVLADDATRDLVQQAARRLIPPSGFEDAALLARAGDFVLGLLPGPDGLSEQQMAYVVRTMATIGGAAAIEKIRPFSEENETIVVNELLRAWRESDDPEEYARTVLRDIKFDDRLVKVQGWHKVLLLHHLRGLKNLYVAGDLTPLTPLAWIPNLRTLSLFQNYAVRDLSPLALSRTLKVLQLTGCTFLRDLSPLRSAGIRELHLYLMPNVDLHSLGDSPITTLSIRDDRLAKGLHALPESLPLRKLRVDNLPDRRNLRGVSRWTELEQVECNGIPSGPEIEELKTLQHLERLTVLGVGAVDAEEKAELITQLGEEKVVFA